MVRGVTNQGGGQSFGWWRHQPREKRNKTQLVRGDTNQGGGQPRKKIIRNWFVGTRTKAMNKVLVGGDTNQGEVMNKEIKRNWFMGTPIKAVGQETIQALTTYNLQLTTF